MKIYFNTKQIKGLGELPLTERLNLIQRAMAKLTGPEKLFLNVLKLLVIIPLFAFILQVSEDWKALIWALLVTLAYPLILKPVQYGLVAKYINLKHAKDEIK